LGGVDEFDMKAACCGRAGGEYGECAWARR